MIGSKDFFFFLVFFVLTVLKTRELGYVSVRS